MVGSIVNDGARNYRVVSVYYPYLWILPIDEGAMVPRTVHENEIKAGRHVAQG